MSLKQNVEAAHFEDDEVEVREDADKPGNVYAVTAEMVEAVQLFLDTVRADAAALPQSVVLAEHTFHLPEVHPSAFGSCDAAVLQPMGKLIVYDFKYGRSFVSADDNDQMKFYGIGALKHPNAFSAEEVELVIVQPRCWRTGDLGPVRRWPTTLETLQAFVGHLHAKAAEAEAGGKLVPGDHCHFCAREGDCAAKHAKVLTAEVCPFDPIVETTRIIPAPPGPSYLTAEQMDRWLELADVLEPHIASVRAAVRAKLERGDPDCTKKFKLVEGRKSRKWTSEENVLALGLPADICYEQSIRSPAQMEKILKANKLDPRVLTPCITESRGVSMVPISDPRPALPPLIPFQPINLIPE